MRGVIPYDAATALCCVCDHPDAVFAGIIAPDIYQGSVGSPVANRGGDAGELTPDTRGASVPVSPGNSHT